MAEGPSGQSPRGPGRKLSLDSVAIYSSPSLPSSLGTPHTHLARKLDEDSGDLRFSNLGVEQKLTLLLKIVEDQMTEKDLFIQSRLDARNCFGFYGNFCLGMSIVPVGVTERTL
ncbi:unnamed protein product [Durusdinium trenchii]|uniref:Uncharacterized protein n=1 Tax=Durusdinium trenchii TaxID=1381693 RepID=A0ABP0H713_9DINO